MKKITKTTARKLFNEGKTIYLLPCKAVIGSCWIVPTPICKSLDEGDFDKSVNAYEYYTCSNATGKYSHYYISE